MEGRRKKGDQKKAINSGEREQKAADAVRQDESGKTASGKKKNTINKNKLEIKRGCFIKSCRDTSVATKTKK